MEPGVVLDHLNALSASTAYWVAGEPDLGRPVSSKGRLAMRAFRCTVCSAVQLYAPAS